MKKMIFLLLGFFFTGLGMIGILLPILPTTPFLLLASFFFARSSPRFEGWLQNTPWLGEYIRHYKQKSGVSLHTKISSLLFLWLFLGYSILALAETWWVKALLLAIACGVSFHLLSIKTRTGPRTPIWRFKKQKKEIK